MAQANLPVLPQISAALAAPPAKPRATADTAGDEQAFAKVLDKHLKPQESPKSPKPEQKAKAADSAADPAPPTTADLKTAVSQATALKTAASHAKADPILLAADALSRLSTAPEEPELAAETDPAAAAEGDPLQASLAGLPAALAALLASAPSAAPPSPTAPPLPTDPALAAAAALPPGSDAIAATLARMLAETAGSRAEAPAPELAGELPQAAMVEGGELPEAGTASLAAEDTGAFAAALGEATGRNDKTAVLPAVDTETGPASRAAETAQLAANPAAGDASAARPETNPSAALAWATAPGRVHHEDGGPRLIVPQPPDHPAWAESVGSKVTWLVGQGESSAELVLTPPQLGRVEVSLSVNGDQTTAQFVAATPAAREALEQALPRLREVLAEAGIQLTQSGVSTSDQQGDRGEGTRQGPRRHEGGGVPGGELEISARPWQRRGEGLVDTFA